ncbi:hypothetical protein Dsin_003802 [Dipteronia sinensis]|uniref:Thaumatin-like protein n=1 Tax=Dipteronia sinensis TaxID=43782 RepID=A0AAE0EKN9_9ROSI|nr:hypothetical protein Dsin_003802 [Dipteronia sinensis]
MRLLVEVVFISVVVSKQSLKFLRDSRADSGLDKAVVSKQQPGKAQCQTGDCSGLLQCQGTGGVPPTTLVEMTLGTQESALHYYDVRLVDGFNVPVSMVPIGDGGGGCGITPCEADLNACCHTNLVVKKRGKVVGCKSACLAAKSDRYCCTGEFSNPKTCRPTIFAPL